MEYYAKFPNSSLSPGVYGSFFVKQIIKGFVSISPELCRSIEGLTLLLLEMAAIGEMVVGMSSREVSASSTLTWDEVLTA